MQKYLQLGSQCQLISHSFFFFFFPFTVKFSPCQAKVSSQPADKKLQFHKLSKSSQSQWTHNKANSPWAHNVPYFFSSAEHRAGKLQLPSFALMPSWCHFKGICKAFQQARQKVQGALIYLFIFLKSLFKRHFKVVLLFEILGQ